MIVERFEVRKTEHLREPLGLIDGEIEGIESGLDLARAGAVTLIQRFGSALNLNIHFHMLFLDGVYEVAPDGTRLRFQWVRAPTSAQLT